MASAPSSSSLLARDVDPDQHDDAREADQQPDEPAARGALGAVEAQIASTATSSGTAAMMIAASDESTCCSPAAISGNGIEISRSA